MRYLPVGQRIWADHHMLHKQGRATHDIEIKDSNILKEYDAWVSVKLEQDDVTLKLQPEYPDFWIEKNLLKDSDVVPPQEVGASDAEFLQAMKVVREWFKE